MKQVIFPTSKRYSVALHPIAGLIVQSTRTNKGVHMKPDHPQFLDWVDGFETAIDLDEADALCHALLS